MHQQISPEQTQLTRYLNPIAQSWSQLPKWPFAIVGMVGVVGTAIYQIRKLESAVYAKELWSTWKRNTIPTPTLETMPEEQLTQLLIAGIQRNI